MSFKEQLEGQKRRQALWQKYCGRNAPMPRDELPPGAASRGNQVLKAKDQADKRKFPALKWWECAEWEKYCPPKSHFSTRHLSVSQVTEMAFQRNMGEHLRKKRK